MSGPHFQLTNIYFPSLLPSASKAFQVCFRVLLIVRESDRMSVSSGPSDSSEKCKWLGSDRARRVIGSDRE